MKVAIGADHAGYELKEKVKKYLEMKGIETEDVGTFSKDSVDYPDYAFEVASQVSDKKIDFGVLVCKSGIGMSIAANKFKNVRAALCFSPEMAKLARSHNDANVLSLSQEFTKVDDAYKIIDTWLATNFEGGRHERRVEKIKKRERED
ncbi:MAG: Ribose 5-phosphate isomerase B [candidate division Zixibacteria bacterium RBG-1]|nr:MAG: Ribose 5-phosphate isomerase B [candidate division Zixibacteria bacterium RBG-1]OGC85183.1 MAG: ribose 5-phosphate isomerase B [candidate division Zixibacteria bacterium RBG_19FT_COMBO_42_43]